MPHAARRPGRAALPTILAAAMMSALLVFAVTAVSVPADAFASVTKAAACTASLRTSPYTTARLRATISTNTRVTVATSVTGGFWRASCAGKTLSGRYWYRISAINGRSVRTLYGVTYLYAALGLFKPVAPAITKYSTCPVSLRTSAATTATPRTRITTGTKVTVVTSVTGGIWSTYCAGSAVAGKYWYRISAINGRSVRALYGVAYLYAPIGLFNTPTTTAPIPTPAPTTSTTGRPFAAPVTTRTVSVPTTIDSTGATNAAAGLQSFIGTVPDGSVIVFKAGGVYRMDRGIAVQNRHNLVFEGNGATLRSTGDGSLMWNSNFVTWASATSVSDIVIRNFVLEGNNPRTGSDIYNPSRESQHGVGIYGGSRIEVVSNTIRHTWGDGVYAANGSTQEWPRDIWVHGNTFDYVGRNALSLIAARNMLIEQNAMDHIGASVLDIEPDHDYQGVANITLRTNTIAIWGLSNWGTLYFVSCSNLTAGYFSTVSDLTISGNVVTGGPPSTSLNANSGGLHTWIGKPNRQSNVTFTNNTTSKAGTGPVLRFEHVDGLTVTGNSQPVTSGSLTRIYDSTSVVSQ